LAGLTASRKRALSRAAILAVGSELLTPLRLDTNSLFITEQLNLLGIEVVSKAVVGDDRGELAHALRTALGRVDLVVLSGGLGPTDDDITREVAAEVLNRPLAEDEILTGRLRARFAARFAGPMPEINRRQAMVPSGARVVENTRGSAPGLWLDQDGRVVLMLPGPPRELKPMLQALVDGPLRERSSGTVLVRRVVRMAGRIESQAEEVLQPLYRQWNAASPPIAATILSALGQLELHLSVKASREAAATVLEAAVGQVVDVFGGDVFTADGQTLEQVVGELLAGRALTIAVAESCTGGLLTSRLTDVAGSSRYVGTSVITYSNEAKTRLLEVTPELIAEHGAVSEPVALAMATGVRARAGADVGVGVTGIAGPGGGTPDKPVGTVAVAVVTARVTRSRVFRFLGEREQVKFQASQAALDMVRRIMIEADLDAVAAFQVSPER
jgi:nicotinamide-nucleotide amidase